MLKLKFLFWTGVVRRSNVNQEKPNCPTGAFWKFESCGRTSKGSQWKMFQNLQHHGSSSGVSPETHNYLAYMAGRAAVIPAMGPMSQYSASTSVASGVASSCHGQTSMSNGGHSGNNASQLCWPSPSSMVGGFNLGKISANNGDASAMAAGSAAGSMASVHQVGGVNSSMFSHHPHHAHHHAPAHHASSYSTGRLAFAGSSSVGGSGSVSSGPGRDLSSGLTSSAASGSSSASSNTSASSAPSSVSTPTPSVQAYSMSMALPVPAVPTAAAAAAAALTSSAGRNFSHFAHFKLLSFHEPSEPCGNAITGVT